MWHDFVSKVHTHSALRENLKNKCVHSESVVHYIPLMQWSWCLTSCQAAEQHATYLCNAELGAHSSIAVCRTLVVAFYAQIYLFDFFDCLIGECHEELKKKWERKNKESFIFCAILARKGWTRGMCVLLVWRYSKKTLQHANSRKN